MDIWCLLYACLYLGVCLKVSVIKLKIFNKQTKKVRNKWILGLGGPDWISVLPASFLQDSLQNMGMPLQAEGSHKTILAKDLAHEGWGMRCVSPWAPP